MFYTVLFKLYLVVLLEYSIEDLVELSSEEMLDKTPSVENWISRTTYANAAPSACNYKEFQFWIVKNLEIF